MSGLPGAETGNNNTPDLFKEDLSSIQVKSSQFELSY